MTGGATSEGDAARTTAARPSPHPGWTPPGLGAGPLEILFALLLSIALSLLAFAADRALASPPTPGVVAVGPLADPHHVHVDAIYGSFARESAEASGVGGLLVHNHQTGEPHEPVLARPWDFLVGRIARGLGRPDPAGLFHVDRSLAIFLFPLGCALLFGEVLRRRATRLGAMLAAVFGGSLYWLAPLREHAGTWLDSIGGLSGLGFAYPALLVGVPHLALEVGAFAGALGAAFRARRTGRARWAAVACAALFVLASVRPYTAPAAMLGSAVALCWGRPRRGALEAAFACLPAAVMLAHVALAVRAGSVFGALDVEHPSPPLVEQLLFVGVPVLVAAAWLAPGVRRRLGRDRLPSASTAGLAAAALVVLALVEGPFVAWQVEAMLPLPLLGLVLAARAVEGLGARRGALGLAALALHLAPSVAYANEARARLADPGSGLWMLRGERDALAHLSQLADGRGLAVDAAPIVLLCEPTFGRVVPWLAGVRVFVGHADHTPSFDAKARLARGFFRFGGGLAALRDAGVTHVLVSPRTPRPPALANEGSAGLQRVFASGDVELFRLAR